MAVLVILILSPLLVFAGAFFRALILFFPTMLVLGVLHNYIPLVPQLGWQATFLLIMALTLLIPTGSTSSK